MACVHEIDSVAEKDRQALDSDGFVVLRNILSPKQVETILNKIKQLAATVPNDPSREAVVEDKMIKLWDLINCGPEFDVFYTHPRVMAAVSHVLGDDFRLHSLGSRSAPPGYGHQKLHLDFGRDLGQPTSAGCNTLWTLVDFSRRNGGTRLVPGSHLWAKHPRDVMADPEQDHPGEIRLEAPAGSVVVFGGHTWHGGAQNNGDDVRWTVLSAFCKRDHEQEKPFAQVINDDVRARLNDSTRRLLDV
jgi:ectoine hydroxylase-related dioxygenase (phytanoyl-CoA dioxygenase family)